MSRPAWDLSERVALVTGASGGLGAHFGKVLATAGARVLLTARRQGALEAVADDIRAAGGQCETALLDITSSHSIGRLSSKFETVDILVNNAGVVTEGAALSQTEAQWDAVIDTNLKGAFLMAKTVAAAMQRRRRGGAIINIASILGLRQVGGALPYAVSKAGAIQLTRVLALELARFDIRVNALAPGYIETDLNRDFWLTDAGKALIRRIPQRRLGQPEDLDGPLLLLASDASRHMTGAVLAVDGGHLVSTL